MLVVLDGIRATNARTEARTLELNWGGCAVDSDSISLRPRELMRYCFTWQCSGELLQPLST